MLAQSQVPLLVSCLAAPSPDWYSEPFRVFFNSTFLPPPPSTFSERIERLHSYLPDNVQEFVRVTINNGSRIMGDLYEDIQREVLTKVDNNIKEFEEAYGLMIEQMLDIFEKYQQMGS